MTLATVGLRTLNVDFENDFNSTVVTILDGAYTLPDGRQLAGVEKDLALTYGCRNRAVHHLSGGRVVNRRFTEVRQPPMNTLFLAVECLRVKVRRPRGRSGTADFGFMMFTNCVMFTML